MSFFPTVDPIVAALRAQVRRQLCENDGLYFARYFFKARENNRFRVNWHHLYIARELQAVLDGETQNLVICVPPGSSKTQLAVVNFIARGLGLNPRARFLHLSYSNDLALGNSSDAKEIVLSDEFQALWPLQLRTDAKSKKRWNVEIEGRKAGGVYAVALGGQITGFRAGHMAEGFQGAILADDLLKPEDAFSKPKRQKANRSLLSTVKSRKAISTTPFVLIMQRVHTEDPVGFIKAGNLPGKWKVIEIPALIDDAYVEILPPEIQDLVDDGGERDAHGRFSYWPYKEPLEELLALEKGGQEKEGQTISRYVFNSQYQQKPSALGGGLIQTDAFRRYTVTPTIVWRIVVADTAQKEGVRNDYSVLGCYGFSDKGRVVLLDLERGKWTAPKLKERTLAFWKRQLEVEDQGALRRLYVEDKASGTGLIQEIAEDGKIPVQAIQRGEDKLTRFMDVQGDIEGGHVEIPEDASWLANFLIECEDFSADMTHAHDDQVDTLIDAIDVMRGRKGSAFKQFLADQVAADKAAAEAAKEATPPTTEARPQDWGGIL